MSVYNEKLTSCFSLAKKKKPEPTQKTSAPTPAKILNRLRLQPMVVENRPEPPFLCLKNCVPDKVNYLSFLLPVPFRRPSYHHTRLESMNCVLLRTA